VSAVNAPAMELFTRASLLQHILVPADKDTLCPYTPLEIGGDGAFPHSVEFMRKVVEDRSPNPRETKYRLLALVNNRFGYKYIRSERLDKVVNKHHLYLPKIEGLRELLPESAIVAPATHETKLMLQSVRFDELIDPLAYFFQLAKGLYYQALLEGKDPPEPVFNIDREFTSGHTQMAELTVDYHLFRETWLNPGFTFQNSFGYWIKRSEVAKINPMNLGWDWDKTKYPDAREILDLWIKENVSFEQTTLPDILGMIQEHRPLPKRVVDRLNLYIESDSYIMHTLDEHYAGEFVTLISRDQRLGNRIKRFYYTRGRQVEVLVVDPAIYMIGRMEEVEGSLLPDRLVRVPAGGGMVIEDPGAMLHVDYTEFTDGFPLREDIWDAPIGAFRNRNGVVVFLI
jgi:hypothetical protein